MALAKDYCDPCPVVLSTQTVAGGLAQQCPTCAHATAHGRCHWRRASFAGLGKQNGIAWQLDWADGLLLRCSSRNTAALP